MDTPLLQEIEEKISELKFEIGKTNVGMLGK